MKVQCIVTGKPDVLPQMTHIHGSLENQVSKFMRGDKLVVTLYKSLFLMIYLNFKKIKHRCVIVVF